MDNGLACAFEKSAAAVTVSGRLDSEPLPSLRAAWRLLLKASAPDGAGGAGALPGVALLEEKKAAELSENTLGATGGRVRLASRLVLRAAREDLEYGAAPGAKDTPKVLLVILSVSLSGLCGSGPLAMLGKLPKETRSEGDFLPRVSIAAAAGSLSLVGVCLRRGGGFGEASSPALLVAPVESF